jgi:predicted dehydrogenase
MRVAVCGFGSAGRRRVEDLHALGHELLVVDPAPPLSPDDLRCAATLEEVVDEVAAVVVSSPNRFHAEQALLALEHGRHVLVEKPLAENRDEADRLVDAAKVAGVTSGVAMNLRFHTGPATLNRLLDDGELGRPLHAAVWFGYDLRRWRPHADYRQSYSARADLGGGVVLDAIHELDILLWLLGPAQCVTGELGHVSDLEIDVEDVALGVLRFGGGVLASVSLNYVDAAYRRGCLVVGTDATARWDWGHGTVVVRDGTGERVLDAACDVRDTYRAEIADFVRAAESGSPPRTSFAAGRAAVALADGLKASAATGRRVQL